MDSLHISVRPLAVTLWKIFFINQNTALQHAEPRGLEPKALNIVDANCHSIDATLMTIAIRWVPETK